jgi:DNA-binding response OmpR family regulator
MAIRSRRREAEELDAGSDASRFASVLVVHEDPEGCEVLARVVERGTGLMVVRAHDPREMSDALRNQPTCVVLDVTSGGVGGNLKLLDAVRNHADEVTAGARVILIAASSSNEMFSWQAGIDAFLKRPFHADELVATVQEAIARPDDERRAHRRDMIDQIANGRRPGR